MKKRILAIGNAGMRLACSLNQIPLVNETTVETGKKEQTAGGWGLYAAAELAALGAEAELCTCVGGDLQGEQLVRFCKSLGISTRFVYREKSMDTAFSLVMTEYSGAVRSVFYPGAFSALRQDHAEEAFISRPDGVCASFELQQSMISYLAQTADELAAKLFLDAAGYEPLRKTDELPRVAAFICEEAELGRMTHILPDTIDNCLKAAVKLSTMLSSDYYIIRLRERGIFVYDGKFCSLVSPVELPALDKRASREAFCAAYAYACLTTGEAETAARYAGVAAALCAAQEGGCSSVPTAAKIERYCRKNNIY